MNQTAQTLRETPPHGIAISLCENLRLRGTMLINGTEIDEDVIGRALGLVDADKGFVAADLQAALEGLGVTKGEIAMRTADRTLQRASRAGKLVWKDRRWRSKGTTQ